MPTEPNKKLLSDPRIPRITLDDQDWPIRRLAPTQLEIVLPLIDEVKRRMHEAPVGSSITKEVLHDMGTILFHALERGHPDLTREEFDDMAIGLTDLVDALPVIQKQSGCYRDKKPSEVNGAAAPLVKTPEAIPTGPASPLSS